MNTIQSYGCGDEGDCNLLRYFDEKTRSESLASLAGIILKTTLHVLTTIYSLLCEPFRLHYVCSTEQNLDPDFVSENLPTDKT